MSFLEQYLHLQLKPKMSRDRPSFLRTFLDRYGRMQSCAGKALGRLKNCKWSEFMEEKFAVAAVRHYRDADMLAASERLDGAGHLIGFSAECAIKHAVLSLRPGVEKIQKHFPDLIDVAKRHLDIRAHHGLYIILKNPAFMQNWTVGSRYSDDGIVTKKMYDLWRSQTRALMYAAKLRG